MGVVAGLETVFGGVGMTSELPTFIGGLTWKGGVVRWPYARLTVERHQVCISPARASPRDSFWAVFEAPSRCFLIQNIVKAQLSRGFPLWLGMGGVYLEVHGDHPYIFRTWHPREVLNLLAQYGVRIDLSVHRGNQMYT